MSVLGILDYASEIGSSFLFFITHDEDSSATSDSSIWSMCGDANYLVAAYTADNTETDTCCQNLNYQKIAPLESISLSSNHSHESENDRSANAFDDRGKISTRSTFIKQESTSQLTESPPPKEAFKFLLKQIIDSRNKHDLSIVPKDFEEDENYIFDRLTDDK